MLKNTANPKDIGKSFFLDLVENQESIRKLPTKLSEKLETREKTQKIEVNQGHRDNLVSASLILGSVYLLSGSLTPSYSFGLGLVGLIAAVYFILSQG